MNLFNSNPRNPLSEVSTEVAGGTTAKGKREKGKSKTKAKAKAKAAAAAAVEADVGNSLDHALIFQK